jgi:hypothetical protein
MDNLSRLRLAAFAVLLPAAMLNAPRLRALDICDEDCQWCASANDCVDFNLQGCCDEYYDCSQIGVTLCGSAEACVCHCEDCP